MSFVTVQVLDAWQNKYSTPEKIF